MLNDVFEKLSNEIELWIITDPVIRTPIGFFNRRTDSVLKTLKCDYHLVEWDKNSFSKIVSDADLAIIPIERNSAMMWNKPENKLLLLWEIGVPTLTSDTPAYRRVMDRAGLDYYCASSNEWLQKVEQYRMSSTQYRFDISEKAKSYLRGFHSKQDILNRWDLIFDSLYSEKVNESSCAV
jgi:hypothetical protein